MDKQTLALQGLWRKAGRQQAPLEIVCKTPAEAARLRFALYNAVRRFKIGSGAVPDAELQEAIHNCALSFKPGCKAVLLLQRKENTGLMQAALAALGDSPLVSSEELAEQEALAGVMERLMKAEAERTDPQATPRNPYYTR